MILFQGNSAIAVLSAVLAHGNWNVFSKHFVRVFVFMVLFAENLSSAAGAFHMYEVPIPPNLITKQGSEEGSNNMDFL